MVGPASFLEGQGWVQVGEVLLAFALSSLIGLERQLRGKSAGLRTQALVGTAAALMLLVSKYGFFDILSAGTVVLDPSRIAAQIVTGVGFLGAGLILTRRGVVRGLTTAAAVWLTAAVGMAAGAGLWLLALVVTALYFVSVTGYTAIIRSLPSNRERSVAVEIVYADGRGVLRQVMAVATARAWRVLRLIPGEEREGGVAVVIEFAGSVESDAVVDALASVDGVRAVRVVVDEEE